MTPDAAVGRALDRARDDGDLVTVLLVDAEDAGRIDRAHGHGAGERALGEIERRLRVAAPAAAEIVRLTRERFVVVSTDLRDEPAALELARALALTARAPTPVEEIAVRLDATVGVALAKAGQESAGALLRDAASAAHRARTAGSVSWQIADPAVREHAVRRLRLEHELAIALERDELALYFQPIVSLRRGTLLGVEALVRWRHPTRGLIGPAQFLPVAEESGLIVEIGDWVLATVCDQVERWSTACPERVLPPISLNISARELQEQAFVSRFTTTLLATRVPPETIALEIAEPGVAGGHGDPGAALGALRRLGVRIVLDQFGGSRSSLAHLAQLPVDGLKLDRALLGSPDAPPGEQPIAEAIVGLANTLGLSITAPGIETQQQLAVVRSLHVDAAQGHLIARPAPATSLLDLRALELDLAQLGRGAASATAGDAPDELLSLSTVAAALGVSPSTVRRLADQGVLPGTRTEGGHRRFRRSDVQRLARERQRTPSLRPWELPARPLPATAALFEHDGRALVERAARALYDQNRPGWFAAPQGLARARAWLGTASTALTSGAARDAVTATAAYGDAATLGGASTAEVVRFLGQFAAVTTHELVRARTSAEEARPLQRLMSAATEAFLDRHVA